MAINLSTAGIQLLYAVETTAGTRPTTASAYTRIKGVKSTPSLNPAPDTLETTTLDETEYKTYIDGLKDLGGSLEFTFNLTEELIDDWETLITWKLLKYFTISFNTHLMYDDDTKTIEIDNAGNTVERGPKVQFKEILGVGFNYSF